MLEGSSNSESGLHSGMNGTGVSQADIQRSMIGEMWREYQQRFGVDAAGEFFSFHGWYVGLIERRVETCAYGVAFG